MFPLQASDELVFGAQIPPPPNCDEDDLLQVMDINDANFTHTNFINFGSNEDSRRVSPTPPNSRLTRPQTHDDMMRVVHRDVERKRRKEMSDLYLTLNSLPSHSIQQGGVCDQMQEAQNYIKTLQNKIQQLRIRRDKLLLLSQNRVGTSTSHADDNHRVTINPLPDGMEILIKSVNSGISCALEVLLGAETEVDVVNCVSTPTHGGFLHKIHIQGRVIDVSVLHDKLSNAMK